MTFLNPLVLIGLAAASIPLVLHLLSLRKPRTIEFSSLAFLKELQRTSIRRLRLRQILLLIARTALVVFIVLAFSRPVFRGSILGSMGTHAHTSAVLVLDDSFSMSASDERGQLFRQAKEIARQIVSVLKEGDEISLLRMSDLQDPEQAAPTHDFEHASRRVVESRLSSSTGSLEDCLRICAKILAGAHNANKEVYVISDMQRALVPLQDKDKDIEEAILPEGTKVFVFSLGTREIDNASVDSVAVRSQILEKGKPVGVTARVRNWGKTPLRDYLVSVYFGGSRVAQQNVDVPPWGSSIVTFTAVPKASGAVGGHVSLEEDAIEDDNRRFFAFTIPRKIRVLFVAPSTEDTRFLSLALTAVSNDGGNGLFETRQISPPQFAVTDLRADDVIICANAASFSESEASKARTFVQGGGGILLFPGDTPAGAGLSSTLLAALDIPPVETRGENTAMNEGVFKFHHVDMDHPLFRGMFDNEGSYTEASIESPEIYRAVRQRAGKRGRTIITMNEAAPFLVEHRVGEGTALVFASAPLPSWTDFPLKGIFAPLIHRCVLFAAAQADQMPAYTVGDEPVLKLGRAQTRDRRVSDIAPRLRSPSGTEELLRPLVGSGDGPVQLPRLLEPGFYQLQPGTEDSMLIPVNVPAAESDLRKMSDDTVEKLLAKFGGHDARILHGPSADRIQAEVLESRYGTELWKACVLAALLFAFLEMIIARESALKERNIK